MEGTTTQVATWLPVAMFAAGVVEYVLATFWTNAIVTRAVGRTAAATFVNVMLWGFVVSNLRISDPFILVIHGLGCALGAGTTCWWAKRAPLGAPRAARRRPRKAEPISVADGASGDYHGGHAD